MITYQDFLSIGDREEDRMDFVKRVINDYTSSEEYKTAKDAYEYYKKRNVTIAKYRKLLYTMRGEAIEDPFGANYKITSAFFNRFINQQTQYLLGNGATFEKDNEKEKLGDDFDTVLQNISRNSLIARVCYAFWNYDHIDIFKATEFKAIPDEEDGSYKLGVRFWQIDESKPLRATLYELDGYTEYIWRNGKGSILNPKRSYILNVLSSDVDGTIIYDGENYPTFPIIPMWGNPEHQSELIGIREQIDAYDLIKSGYCNNVDEASIIYWTINNAGGMDDVDLARFIERMKTVHAAKTEDGVSAEPHTIEVPVSARESLLDRLRSDLYEDYQALDTKNIANGAVTATQIQAAYETVNIKADMFEYCVHEFLKKLFNVAGIDSEVTFTRSMVVNKSEEIENVIQASQYLSKEYITEKILTLFGDGDRVDEVLKAMNDGEIERYGDSATTDRQETGGDGSGTDEDIPGDA